MSALKFAAVGAAAAAVVYVEDVFSTYLYTGNSTTQTITNGIDLAGKGGLVWTKSRNLSNNNNLVNTIAGVGKSLASNNTSPQQTQADQVTAFNSNGYTLGADAVQWEVNRTGFTYPSWTFRKQPKFFDVVTYTGTGAANQIISHSLDSVPGGILIKRLDTSSNWPFWRRQSDGNYRDGWLNLNYGSYNTIDATTLGLTSTTFNAGKITQYDGYGESFNASGGTYVAYLFAHNAGGFGLTGTDNVISCGSYTGLSTGRTVTLGYEPQWVLVKKTNATSNWYLLDTMRGMTTYNTAGKQELYPNWAYAQAASSDTAVSPTSTGFIVGGGGMSDNGDTYIYIAIRRGPMKVPTLGTTVFSPALGSGTAPGYVSGFPVDLGIERNKGSAANTEAGSRLTGATVLQTNTQAAEANSTNTKFDYMNGFFAGTKGTNEIAWMFRRAPGFFDVVCYTGTGVAMTVPHNLTVAPELILLKERQPNGYPWLEASNFTATTYQYALPLSGSTDNSTSAAYGTMISAKPTASVLNLGAQVYVNSSTSTYIAYLFATCAGVSKVGTYIGNGTLQTINCGFTAGARFILIKRPVTGGAVFVWDSARGIVAGNDPYLNLSTTAAEVTTDDSVDTDSSGFIVNQLAATNINVSAASYIFLAIS